MQHHVSDQRLLPHLLRPHHHPHDLHPVLSANYLQVGFSSQCYRGQFVCVSTSQKAFVASATVVFSYKNVYGISLCAYIFSADGWAWPSSLPP